jgi:hypothetical protein
LIAFTRTACFFPADVSVDIVLLIKTNV